MAIYRGTGSASSTSDQTTIDTVTAKALEASNSATAAASSASQAASSASTASGYVTTVQTSATAAETAKTAAETAKTAAETAKTAAETAQTAAETAETNAETAESNASTSATNAATSATNASTSATAAASSATDAETAQTAAETAQAAAETAYDNFDDRYLGAKASDPTVDNDGDALIDGALYFDTTAHQMKVYDLTNTEWLSFSLTTDQLADVDTVATNIADVTSVADNMADVQAAQTSATNAANSATASANSATASASSATSSAASATAAAASATAAATSFDDFDDKYLGAKSSAPSTDNDGDALVQGALYYDTTEGSMYVYEGSAWIKASASIVDTWNEYVYTATNAQTAFTGADDNTNTLVTSDYMIVTRNGIRLTLGVGYTVTTGTVTLTTGANTGDIITITALAPLQVADTLSLSQGGTVVGNVVFNGNVDGIAFSEIDSTPTTLAGYGITDAATSAQGALADSATQPGDLATVATTGAYSDLTGSPTAVSSFTNDSGYITDYTVTQGDVTTHQAALSITESQISDLQTYATASNTMTFTNKSGNISQWTNDSGYITGYTVTQGDVTAHQAALSITESQISDLGTYLEDGFSITAGTLTTANMTTADFGDWTVTESAGVLYFKHSGTNKMKLDSSGNLTVTGNVTAYGTV